MQNAKTLCWPTQSSLVVGWKGPSGWKPRWKVPVPDSRWGRGICAHYKISVNISSHIQLEQAWLSFYTTIKAWGSRFKVQFLNMTLTLNFLMACISGCWVWMFVVYFFFVFVGGCDYGVFFLFLLLSVVICVLLSCALFWLASVVWLVIMHCPKLYIFII